MNPDTAILYVEDDASSRKIMKMLLGGRLRLFNVTIFEDSQDFAARAAAINPRPDVVFLDIHVKPHTGFEMLAALRQIDAYTGVPVVALTASVMNEEVQMLRTAGFDGCLAKPIDMETFPELLNRILAGETVWRIVG
jgi:CheY-like chemotaxis protein